MKSAGYQHHQPSLQDITDAQLEETFRTNIFGYFYMARAAMKRMPPGSAILKTGYGQPEKVAPAYVFFAANTESSYITGEVLTLLGGETAAA